MKNDVRNKSMSSQIVLGLLVIGMGLLFLFDNLDLIEMHHAIAFWPLVFIIAGVVKLFDTGSPNRYLFGAVLVGIGVALTLDRLGIITISWGMLWPLLLIAVGVLLLFKAKAGYGLAQERSIKDIGGSDGFIDATAIMGRFERRITLPSFRGGEVTAVMGGCELDMRGASIDGEAVINVFALWGGVEIKVPPDWTVILHGTPIMGAFEEKTVRPPDTSKRLVIKGYAIMGGVEVRN